MTASFPRSFQSDSSNRTLATALAITVHVLLLAFLWLGVSWHSQTPTTVEAEIWDLHPQQPARPISPMPTPIVRPQPAAHPVEPKIVVQKPDIVIAPEKKQKVKPEPALQPIAPIKEKKVIDKKQALETTEQKLRDKIREEEMRRIAETTGTTGKDNVPRATGNPRASEGYTQKIGAKIKSNAIFSVPKDLIGNPSVEYFIELLPDGSLRAPPRKIKSSNVAGFDEVVERAIEKSQPFPADQSGRVPSSITISHKPKDE